MNPVPLPVFEKPTAVLVLANGAVVWGRGTGATGQKVGELCFNTAITGYQEIMTDPSYAGQIITFTFPHIGNVGTNTDDIEALTPCALGCIIREPITPASNYRSLQTLDGWLNSHGLIGMSGVDTRALTNLIRQHGALNAVIAHAQDGEFDIAALAAMAKNWSGLEGMDLAQDVWGRQSSTWKETRWDSHRGYGVQNSPCKHVVVVDYGVKRNILRNLASTGARITVVPGSTPHDEIAALKPDGVFLSNGPGDPAATGLYAVPTIQKLIVSGVPLFGICLGHQLLALALGGRTYKMQHGHRGANHPVKELATSKVEITSMNHGFAVDASSLPGSVTETHISLFDGSNCGLKLNNKPVFSVQHHPEASPGPQDSFYLFDRFMAMMG